LDLHLRHVRRVVDGAQAPPDSGDDDEQQQGRADEGGARSPLSSTSAGTRMAPRTSPALISDSSSAKTCPRTCGGAARCSRMRPVTLNTARPTPVRASSANAPTTEGKMPRITSANAAVTMPAMSAGARRRRATSAAVTATPMSPPAPNAELK